MREVLGFGLGSDDGGSKTEMSFDIGLYSLNGHSREGGNLMSDKVKTV